MPVIGADPGGGRWGGRPPLGQSFNIQEPPFISIYAALHHWAPSPGRNPVSAPALLTGSDDGRNGRLQFVFAGSLGQHRVHGVTPRVMVSAADRQRETNVIHGAVGGGVHRVHGVTPRVMVSATDRQRETNVIHGAVGGGGVHRVHGVTPRVMVSATDRQRETNVIHGAVRGGGYRVHGVTPRVMVSATDRQRETHVIHGAVGGGGYTESMV